MNHLFTSIRSFFTVAFIFSSLIAFGQVNLQTGLIHCYPFEGNTNDVVGICPGVYVGTPTYKDVQYCIPNQSIVFGKNPTDHVTLGSCFKLPDTFTVAMVIDVETFVGHEWRILFINENDEFWFGLRDDQIVFWTPGGSVESNSIQAQNPVHICWVGIKENGMFRVSIYIDGQLDAIDLIPLFPTPDGETTIGGSDSGDNIYMGSIDDLRIYNRTLSHMEIEELADSCKPTPINDFYITNQKIAVTPNPNPGIFTLQFEKEATHTLAISIFNSLGKRSEFQKLGKGITSHEFDLSGQTSGIYFLTIQDIETGTLLQTQKFLIR